MQTNLYSAGGSGRERGPVPRSGSGGGGSTEHWTNGMGYSDWLLGGGSQIFRDGRANGLTSIGGRLRGFVNGFLSNEAAEENMGELGYWEDGSSWEGHTVRLNGDLVKLKTLIKTTKWVAQANGGIQYAGLGGNLDWSTWG